MFDLAAKLLCSVASFLFPVFASYKALKANDPAQLTPWLMYWVVIACVMVIESWVGFILVWLPFYQEIKAGFMLWLVMPHFKGATRLYLEQIHPFLEQYEQEIEDFISSSHDKAKSVGIRRHPAPGQQEVASSSAGSSSSNESYAQNLLSRFRMNPITPYKPQASTDFYSFLSSALLQNASGDKGPTSGGAIGAASASAPGSGSEPGILTSLFGPSTASVAPSEQIGIIAQHRDRLRALLHVLDREASKTPEPTPIAAAAAEAAPEDHLRSPALSKSESLVNLEDFDHVNLSEADTPGSSTEEQPKLQKRDSYWSWFAKSSQASTPVVEVKEHEE
ncbi:hypothetical protein BJ508DRAFT_143507 [Ascobolus immersus RN42]|uniref:Protein YOP1 n=1 Tax=Ascobolus immersus RN42 TaxID=1160509 RepID=A0A3N4I518_ASCIM|nr:hypothetical protein BJ508DRAFT_143507 [Ascobolus immersus RN42]